MIMRVRLSLTYLLFFLCVAELSAQQTGGTPPNNLLPEINPQDIEIRSEFRARFPGLRRQPILGFNPRPRVFQIDPNRLPFMESRDQAVASIAITQLDRPEPPSRSMQPVPARTRAWARAGFGSFVTPEIEAYAWQRINDSSSLSGRVQYVSTDGHLQDPLTSFRYLDTGLQYRNRLNERTSLTVDAGFLNDFNRMFDLQPVQQNLIGETALKQYSGFSGRAEVDHKKNSIEGWNAYLDASAFLTNLQAGPSLRTGEVNEQVIDAGFEYQMAGAHLYEIPGIKARVRSGGYQSTSGGSESWILGSASATYRLMLLDDLHLSGEGGLAYVSDEFSNQLYVVADMKARYNLQDRFVVTASLFSQPEMTTMQEHQEYNRFLNTAVSLQHSRRTGLSGSAAFNWMDGNRIYAGVSAGMINNYAFYQRGSESVLGNPLFTFYELSFADARIAELYGGITQYMIDQDLKFDARVYLRSPNFSSGGTIPFEERVGVDATVSYTITADLSVSSWAEYRGERMAPSATGGELPAFLLFNAGADYQINDRFGVYLKVLNILGQDYEIWEGYVERPLQLFGGITFKL